MPKVQLFIPCFVDQLFPQTGLNMAKVLEHFGCEVSFNPNQTCCGQPAYNAGYQDEAREIACKFVTDFNDVDYIVAPSGSCTGFIRSYYPHMLEHSKESNKGKQIVQRAFEFSEFLVDVLKVQLSNTQFPHKVTYHDACGALRECGIKAQPRTLLNQIKVMELVEMKECETCCGFGGTFAIKYEPISIGMAQNKVQSALATGASYIISTDVSCMMHMQAYIDKNQLPIQTIHIADILISEIA
jgi:L-lactate dehydrogenase complex protein LldE